MREWNKAKLVNLEWFQANAKAEKRRAMTAKKKEKTCETHKPRLDITFRESWRTEEGARGMTSAGRKAEKRGPRRNKSPGKNRRAIEIDEKTIAA